jgi:hypothetical protein
MLKAFETISRGQQTLTSKLVTRDEVETRDPGCWSHKAEVKASSKGTLHGLFPDHLGKTRGSDKPREWDRPCGSPISFPIEVAPTQLPWDKESPAGHQEQRRQSSRNRYTDCHSCGDPI